MDVTAFISRGGIVCHHGISNFGANKNSGFTLLNLLIVIAILSVLFSVSIPSLHGVLTSNRISVNVNKIVAY